MSFLELLFDLLPDSNEMKWNGMNLIIVPIGGLRNLILL